MEERASKSKMNKKGILGLDTVKAVMLALIVITLLAVTAIAILVPMMNTADTVDPGTTVAFVNQTTSIKMNTSQTATLFTFSSLRNCQMTVTTVINTTGTVIAATGNYTVSGCSISATATPSASANNTFWNVTGTYNYDSATTGIIVGNLTTGTDGFFSNVPTFFVLLGVVVLILVLAIVIVAASRLGMVHQRENL